MSIYDFGHKAAFIGTLPGSTPSSINGPAILSRKTNSISSVAKNDANCMASTKWKLLSGGKMTKAQKRSFQQQSKLQSDESSRKHDQLQKQGYC